MDHQDWETHFVNCVVKDNKTEKHKSFHKDVSRDVKIEKLVEDDKLKHTKIPKELSREIQQKRLQKGMKQKELANLINVNVSVINDIETGKAIYNGKLLSKIKKRLQIK